MSTRLTMLIAATAASPKPPAVRLRIEAATAASAFLRRLGMPFRRIVGESLAQALERGRNDPEEPRLPAVVIDEDEQTRRLGEDGGPGRALDAEAQSEDEGGRERKIEDAAREQRAHADDGKALASEQVVEGEARAHDGRADEKNLGVATASGHDRGRRAQDPEERLVKE